MMPNDKSGCYSESELEARSRMRQLYNKLETLLKRHQPKIYASFSAEFLRKGKEDFQYFKYAPPHLILHSIEANCAFARGQNADPVDWNRFARIINTYHDHEDQFQTALIPDNLQMFFLWMFRQQIEIQYEPFKNDIARGWALFVKNKPLSQLEKSFFKKYHLSFEEWFKCCFAAHVAAEKAPNGFFLKGCIKSLEPLKKLTSLETFYKISSITPKEIGKEFKRIRSKTRPQFHSLIRTIFLDKPLIDFGHEVCCPKPSLMFRHSNEGLHKLLKDSSELKKEFGKEFGRSFENYIFTLLALFYDKVNLLNGKELEKKSPGKSCDFLLETKDCIILVECKTVRFNARILTENIIADDGSTTRVVSGLEQLYTTARDLENGVFPFSDVDNSKPTLGIVVTYGDIPFVNKDWYFETFFESKSKTDFDSSIYPSKKLSRRPIVLSVSGLEKFITVLNNAQASPLGLCERKNDKSYNEVGDWNIFLNSELKSLEKSNGRITPLSCIQDSFNMFLESLEIRKTCN